MPSSHTRMAPSVHMQVGAWRLQKRVVSCATVARWLLRNFKKARKGLSLYRMYRMYRMLYLSTTVLRRYEGDERKWRGKAALNLNRAQTPSAKLPQLERQICSACAFLGCGIDLMDYTTQHNTHNFLPCDPSSTMRCVSFVHRSIVASWRCGHPARRGNKASEVPHPRNQTSFSRTQRPRSPASTPPR